MVCHTQLKGTEPWELENAWLPVCEAAYVLVVLKSMPVKLRIANKTLRDLAIQCPSNLRALSLGHLASPQCPEIRPPMERHPLA